MCSNCGTIISYTTSDGLTLKGHFTYSPSNSYTIIHIHGSCGNFYENDFIPLMAEMYRANGINFLSVNNRGHDCIAEAYQNGQLVYIGGCYETFSKSVLDIQGAIDFANLYNTSIILQGHSLGCLKVINFARVTNIDCPIILLSPSDAYQVHANYISPETVADQLRRLKSHIMDPFELLLKSEFGARQKATEYYIPTTLHSLTSLIESPAISLLRYNQDLDYRLDIDGFIYYGGRDPLWTVDAHAVKEFFERRFKSLQFHYCAEGDHHFHGFEQIVLMDIVDWALHRSNRSKTNCNQKED